MDKTVTLLEVIINDKGINCKPVEVLEKPKTFKFTEQSSIYRATLPKECLKKAFSSWHGMIFYCYDTEEDLAECIHQAREVLKEKVEASTKALQTAKGNLHNLNESLKKFKDGKFKVK